MEKEPITLNGLIKLKDELVFLKEKKIEVLVEYSSIIKKIILKKILNL